jgi:hypothetical protein
VRASWRYLIEKHIRQLNIKVNARSLSYHITSSSFIYIDDASRIEQNKRTPID